MTETKNKKVEKIKKRLYKNIKTNTYYIHYGAKITVPTLEEALEIYEKLENLQWTPSKCIAYIDSLQTRESDLKKIAAYKSRDKIALYLKGFYVQSGTIPEIKQTIQEYINTNYADTYIDYKRNNLRPHKKRNLPKHITYIQQTNKYRISKHIKGKTYYYGTYTTLEEAKKQVKELEKTNWQIPKPKRKPYDTSKENRYIQQQPKTKHYFIIKNGEHYGTYNTLEKAREERDWLIKNNWSYENIDLY